MPFLYALFLIILLLASQLVQADSQLKLQPRQTFAQEGFASLIADPKNPDVLYGISPLKKSSSSGLLLDGGYLYKSNDRGVHWTLIMFDGHFQKLLVDPVNTQHLYALNFAIANMSNIIESTDGGKTWRSLFVFHGDFDIVRIPDLFVSFTSPNRFYVLSDNRLYGSDDAGTNWREINISTLLNTPEYAFRATSFVVHPNNFDILYATQSAHLFQSKDAGATWQHIPYRNIVTETLGDSSVGRVSKSAILKKLWINPSEPDVLYLNVVMEYFEYMTQTGDTTTYKSRDEGKTWQAISLPLIQTTECTRNCYGGLFYIDPYRKGVLYSYVSLDYPSKYIFTLYRSQDDGNTWNEVLPMTSGVLSSILSDPQQLDVFYVSTTTVNTMMAEGQLQVTENAGKTWRKLDSTLRNIIDLNDYPVLHPKNPKIFYVKGSNSLIYQTVDGGHTFTALPSFMNETSNYTSLDSDSIIAVTENAVFGSKYRWVNQQWQDYGANNQANRQKIAVRGSDVYKGDYVVPYSATYNSSTAIYSRSRDEGKTWHILNSGKPLPIMDQGNMSLVVHPTEKNKLYLYFSPYVLSTSEHQPGVYQSVDDGETWQDISGDLPAISSGYSVPYQFIPHPTQSQTLYYSYEGYIHKTVDNGKTWKIIGSGDIPRGSAILWFDPNNSQTIYAMLGPNFLYKSTDAGETWRNVSLALQEENAYTATIEALRFAPDDNKIIYIARAKERIYQSEDGEHWEVITDASKLERESPTGVLLAYSVPSMTFKGVYYVEHTGNAIGASLDNYFKQTYTLTNSLDNISVQVAEYANQSTVNLKRNEAVTVQAKFEINNITAYEQPAAFFVVARYQPLDNSDAYWFMQTEDKQWKLWDGNIEHLKPAKQVSQLKPTESLDIFTGTPNGVARTTSIYAGYHPANSRITISNQNTPLVLQIE